MSNQRAGTFSNSFTELQRSLYKTLTGLILKVLKACGYISEESDGVSNDVKGAEYFVKLFDDCVFIMIHKFLIDAGQGVDTIL